eukprot:GHVT01014038.1.p1 GENE.GHVT01014038.1~~GHVT01014038.1.p1  ORF type:complete len:133 (-),score=0.27 GHVT01014038.1:171-569(-)
MPDCVGINEKEGARALLDLRYGGNDAIIRSATPATYPSMEGIDENTTINNSVGTTDKVLWQCLLAGTRGSRGRTGKMARFPRSPHVTAEQYRVSRERSLAGKETSRWTRRKSAIASVLSKQAVDRVSQRDSK